MFHLFSVLKTGVCLPQRSAMQPVNKPGLIEVAERPQRKRSDSRYTEVILLFKHRLHIHAETEQNSHTASAAHSEHRFPAPSKEECRKPVLGCSDNN